MADGTCSVPECERIIWSRGWCLMHYGRNWKNNDPEEFGMPRRKAKPPRPDISYHHTHVRLRAERGRAAERDCEDCGQRKAHGWSYDHSDPNPLRSPEGYPYSLDLWNYWALCSSCHTRHDRGVA